MHGQVDSMCTLLFADAEGSNKVLLYEEPMANCYAAEQNEYAEPDEYKIYDNTTMKDEFTFPREKLDIIRELGSGQFGQVLLAKADGLNYAVKTLKGR